MRTKKSSPWPAERKKSPAANARSTGRCRRRPNTGSRGATTPGLATACRSSTTARFTCSTCSIAITTAASGARAPTSMPISPPKTWSTGSSTRWPCPSSGNGNASMGTCDCIWHDGVYHMFYTDHGSRCEYKDKPQRGAGSSALPAPTGSISRKTSSHWCPAATARSFAIRPAGLFHLVRGGGSRLVSKDLRNWKEVPGEFVHAQAREPAANARTLFEWNGWYYFILGTTPSGSRAPRWGPGKRCRRRSTTACSCPRWPSLPAIGGSWRGSSSERGWGGHLALRELIQYRGRVAGDEVSARTDPGQR